MTSQYILVGREPQPEPDILAWSLWMASHDQHIAADTIGDLWVSTVFLGIDMATPDDPMLFETMIFDRDKRSVYRENCRTRDEAETMHAEAVDLARSAVASATSTIANSKREGKAP